ncbi:hypothetical protein DVW12_17105 [Clostridium botulinum]|nr:hypothetical protein [Clostridium botulinum]
MNSTFRDLIEYSGICTYLPNCIEYFTYFNSDDFITLSPGKPSIKQISKVSVRGSVENGNLIKSNIGRSLTGVKSKGFKYLCQGIIHWRVEYIDTDRNTVFSTSGKSKFNTFVNLSTNYEFNAPIASMFIDDVNIELLTSRKFMLNFTGTIIIENN